jgi:hypothetical protein
MGAVFGGITPAVGVYVSHATHTLFAWMIYPAVCVAVCVIVMWLFFPETYEVDISRVADRDVKDGRV